MAVEQDGLGEIGDGFVALFTSFQKATFLMLVRHNGTDDQTWPLHRGPRFSVQDFVLNCS